MRKYNYGRYGGKYLGKVIGKRKIKGKWKDEESMKLWKGMEEENIKER